MASTQPGSAAHAPSAPDAPAPVAPDAKAPTAADGSAANGAAAGPAKGTAGPAKGTAGPAKGTAGLAKGTAAGLSELIVGSERGLEAWSLDGARRRTISAAPARHPRWLDPQTVLAIAPREDRALAAGATLQRITLADGRREDIVELPPLSCKPAAASSEEDSFPYEVDLQDDTDFVVAPARGIACMQLLDRNINMASVMLDVRVDLRRRRVERWLVAGG